MAKRSVRKNQNIEKMKWLYVQRAYSDIEMAEELGVDRTTVYKTRRFMEEELEIPIYPTDERGKYRIDRQALLTNVQVNPAEALALYLGARRLQQQTKTSQAAVANALYKLAKALRKPLMEQVARAAEVILEQEQDTRQQAVMETLLEGWVQGFKVRIRHRKLHGQLRTYTVSPYQLEPSVWGDGIYLIGHSDHHNDLATFKVARIEEARTLPQSFTIPDDFDVHELLQHAWGIWHADGEPETVRLRFSRQVAPRVKESIWHPDQAVRNAESGGCIWEAQVAEWKEMVPWIRGWGADVEVLAPVSLRRELEREVLQLADVYQIVTQSVSAQEDDEDYDDQWAAALFRK